MAQLTIINKRPSFLSFPIPFDHPFTLPTLIATLSTSALLYYYLQATHAAELVEAVRKRDIKNRSQLERTEDCFASLKIDNRFVNPFKEWHDVPFLETALFWLRRWKGNGLPKTQQKLEQSLPVQRPSLEAIFFQHSRVTIKQKQQRTEDNNTDSVLSTTAASGQEPPKKPVTFTWFGQSTCLITVEGLAVLTDPVFSRCSINDYLGPKRLRPVPCLLQDFQQHLDVVLVSHDHFDHLDEKVVYQLGNSVTWYIPLGLGDWFFNRNVTNVVEMDWWQEIRHHSRPDIIIGCVPAMHWSGSRTPFEKNGTLWCSFVIKGEQDTIFFCGDTGYQPELFKAIGDIYAPFSLAAIPIGSFKPESMMQCVHMGPEDAIKAHEDLGMPRLSVGIHWGTFMMSDEHYLDPPRTLAKIWKKRQKQLQSVVRGDDDNNSNASVLVSATSLSSSEQQSKRLDPLAIVTPKSNDDDDQASMYSSFVTLGMDQATTPSSQFVTTAFGETVFL